MQNIEQTAQNLYSTYHKSVNGVDCSGNVLPSVTEVFNTPNHSIQREAWITVAREHSNCGTTAAVPAQH